jgi:hypothetical protein
MVNKHAAWSSFISTDLQTKYKQILFVPFSRGKQREGGMVATVVFVVLLFGKLYSLSRSFFSSVFY